MVIFAFYLLLTPGFLGSAGHIARLIPQYSNSNEWDIQYRAFPNILNPTIIEFRTDDEYQEVTNYYTKILPELGWQVDTRDTKTSSLADFLLDEWLLSLKIEHECVSGPYGSIVGARLPTDECPNPLYTIYFSSPIR